MNPVLVPMQEYQRTMLTRELAALVDMGIDTPPFVYNVQFRLGATPAEAAAILQEVRNQ